MIVMLGRSYAGECPGNCYMGLCALPILAVVALNLVVLFVALEYEDAMDKACR